MRRLSALSLAALTACATAPKPPPAPFIPEARRPEVRTLPPNPREETLQFSGPELVKPLEKGQTVVEPGLWASEARVARDVLFRTRYDELRRVYEADRLVWSAHRDYYEERLHLAGEEIEKLQPTWWDRNKETVLFIAGTLVGFGVTLGITQAVYAGSK